MNKKQKLFLAINFLFNFGLINGYIICKIYNSIYFIPYYSLFFLLGNLISLYWFKK